MDGEQARLASGECDEARKPTIYDVAELAGVSYATVSRHLNGRPNVSVESAQKIDQAIRDIDFTPRLQAQSLARNATHLVALIIHGAPETIFSDPNAIQFMTSVNERMLGERRQLVTLVCDGKQSEATISQMVRAGFADGYLLFTFGKRNQFLNVFQKSGVPAVVSGTGFVADASFVSVDIDNRAAMEMVIDHVIRTGHNRLGFVCGPLAIPGSRARLDVFIERTSSVSNGGTSPVYFADNWFERSGTEAVRRWHDTGILSELDAIICACDVFAVGVVKELHHLCIRVPEDISVTGFDNSSAALSIEPAITTVDQHMDLRADRMIDLLLREVDGHAPQGTVVMQTDLVIRESSR